MGAGRGVNKGRAGPGRAGGVGAAEVGVGLRSRRIEGGGRGRDRPRVRRGRGWWHVGGRDWTLESCVVRRWERMRKGLQTFWGRF